MRTTMREAAGLGRGLAANAGWRPVLAAGVGLGCFLSTLLLYSETITPFQRFPGIESFVGTFAPLSLALAAIISAVLLVAGWRGRFVSGRVLWLGGGVLYVACGVAFACATILSVPQGPVFGWVVGALAAGVALGSVGVALTWGRACTRLTMRRSLLVVALAGLVACAIGPVLASVPAPATVAVFGVAALAAAVLPGLLGACETEPSGARPAGSGLGPASVRPADAPTAGVRPAGPSASARRPRRGALPERLRSFLDVTAPAFTGLLAFAFVMGMMRGDIVEAYPIHLATMTLVSVVLLGLGLGLGARRRLLVRIVERRLIPVLAVTLLAVTNVTAVLWGGAAIDQVLIYLLYTLAASLTLASLSAMAHAGEFAPDVIFSMALTLFSLASYAGLQVGEAVTSEQGSAAITIVTTVYAFVMVLLPGLRVGEGERWGGEGEAEAALAWGPGEGDAEGLADADVGVTGASGGVGERGRVAGAASGAGRAAGTGPVRDRSERCADLVASGGLTAREAEVLAILAEGHASGYISEVLYISPNTARTHIHNIYRKLSVGSREELLVLLRG